VWKGENKTTVFEGRMFEYGRQNKRDSICSNFYYDFTQFIHIYIFLIPQGNKLIDTPKSIEYWS
jgi:hypothetical protein